MNAKQRAKNRENTRKLSETFKAKQLLAHVCENCGEPGGHWVSLKGMSLEAMILGVDDSEGFWTCGKRYDEVGRRLESP